MHLRGYGLIKVFRSVSANGDAQYWATNDLDMTGDTLDKLRECAWTIENYHRGLKQCFGVDKSHVCSAGGQMSHIALSIREFVRLETHRPKTGVSW